MNKNTKEDCEMKKEEYLSLIDEVIAQGPYTDMWDSLCEHPTPKWYARDKFGIFIHWGVYSVCERLQRKSASYREIWNSG